jgi:hypothetical protein
MSAKWCLGLVLAAALAGPAAPVARAQQDYLTQTEADKVRDAQTANERVKLFLDFAADRLRRFKHELGMKGTGPRRADFLNSLLDAFTDCVDEASSRIDDAISNGKDVRKGIKDMQKRAPEFLAELKKIQSSGVDTKPFHFALVDAISDVQDDIKDAANAKKRLELNPPVKHHNGARR